MTTKLNIIIPCYNEKNTIESLVNNVLSAEPMEKQVFVVNDCSNDGTSKLR